MDELFKDLEISEEVKEKLTDRLKATKNEWIEGSRNNPDFINKIRTEEAGKFYNSIEKVIKRNLDVDLDSIDSELTGLKRQEALLKLGVQSIEKNKDKTNQELQSELLKARAEKKELEEEGIPKILAEERQKHYKKYISEAILKDTLEFKTTCNEKARVAMVLSYLQENKFSTQWDSESGNYSIFTKDNLKPTLNDKALSNKELVQLALDESGVLIKSNGIPAKDGIQINGQKPKNGELSDNAKQMLASFQK